MMAAVFCVAAGGGGLHLVRCAHTGTLSFAVYPDDEQDMTPVMDDMSDCEDMTGCEDITDSKDMSGCEDMSGGECMDRFDVQVSDFSLSAQAFPAADGSTVGLCPPAPVPAPVPLPSLSMRAILIPACNAPPDRYLHHIVLLRS